MGDYTDRDAADALVKHVGRAGWEAVTYSLGLHAIREGKSNDQVARLMYERGPHSLTRCRELAPKIRSHGFLDLLSPRKRTGSAANPITKLFPATITEQRFLETLDELCAEVEGLGYTDQRETGHSLVDFTLHQGDDEVPINVKNAGTRFERAMDLVGLAPEDCVPIPAYKAHGAVDAEPNLLYTISVDYGLIGRLNEALPQLLSRSESIVWDLLSRYSGPRIRTAEDAFIFGTTRRYWEEFRKVAEQTPFHTISARKSIRILQKLPKRTPGIGLRAWGTGASAEVNVHVSIREDTTPWGIVQGRIAAGGLEDIVNAVNRRRREWVYDPEI